MSAPCHTKCRSAQPTICAAGRSSNVSITVIGVLPVVAAALEQFADFAELFGRRALGRERLHDELRRGSAEGPVEEIAHELTLRLILGELRVIDVRAIGLVAADQTLLG